MSEQKKRILLVEDSEPLRKVLMEKLEDAGFIILEAKTGTEGLDLAIREKPDAILTDIVMFPMDGIEMARKIRTEGGAWGRKTHIIILTNSTGARDRIKTDDLDLDAYFVKAETSMDEVVSMVEHALK